MLISLYRCIVLQLDLLYEEADAPSKKWNSKARPFVFHWLAFPVSSKLWTAEIQNAQRTTLDCRFLFRGEGHGRGVSGRGFVMNRKDRRATHKRSQTSHSQTSHSYAAASYAAGSRASASYAAGSRGGALTSSPTASLIASATRHLQAGQLAEAQRACQEVLRLDRDHFSA